MSTFRRFGARVVLVLALLGLSAWAGWAQGLPAGVAPQSSEAWAYLVSRGEGYSHALYAPQDGALRCTQGSPRAARHALEVRAEQGGLHPAFVAEAVSAFLWDDWGRLHIPGYDLREVVAERPDLLEPLLEAFYQAHQACALGLMRVLVDGYEGGYQARSSTRYERIKHRQGERYALLAFFPKYFPGTGIFEPLGVVHGVKLAELMQISLLRKPALAAVAATLRRRVEAGGDPLRAVSLEHPQRPRQP